MGTPDFAVPALMALVRYCQVQAVFTQPPRPAGRGKAVRQTPVAVAARQCGIPVHTPTRLREPDIQAVLRACQPDLIVVAAYGLLLPQAVLDMPPMGCWNIHASLLPRWRGAAPIQRAIAAGDNKTGITIMQMDSGLDTGAMLLQETVVIGPDTTAGSLHDTLASLGAALLMQALARRETLVPVPQPEVGVTYAEKLTRADEWLNWQAPAPVLARQVRALSPVPGAKTHLWGQPLKILEAWPVPPCGQAAAGVTLNDALQVACGQATALQLVRVQMAGKSAMNVADFLNGRPVVAGTSLAL